MAKTVDSVFFLHAINDFTNQVKNRHVQFGNFTSFGKELYQHMFFVASS